MYYVQPNLKLCPAILLTEVGMYASPPFNTFPIKHTSPLSYNIKVNNYYSLKCSLRGGDIIWRKGTIHGAADCPDGPTVEETMYGMTDQLSERVQ